MESAATRRSLPTGGRVSNQAREIATQIQGGRRLVERHDLEGSVIDEHVPVKDGSQEYIWLEQCHPRKAVQSLF